MPTTHPHDDVHLFGTVPLFQGLRPEEIMRIHALGRRQRVSEGEWLFRQGRPATTMFLLVEGRVRVVQAGPHGQQVVLHLCGPGDMFGCSAVLGERQYPGSAEVISRGCVERFDEAALRTITSHYPEVARNAVALLAGRIQELRTRFRENITQHVEQRIAGAMLRLIEQAAVSDGRGGCRIAVRLSRQDLAELVGTTMHTVSRTLVAWQSRGIVELARQRVCVRDVSALVALAAAPGTDDPHRVPAPPPTQAR